MTTDVEVEYPAGAADALLAAAVDDRRFDPDAVEAAVRRLVAAWAAAVGGTAGDRAGVVAVAVRPAAGDRVVRVRDLRVTGLQVTEVRVVPPLLAVTVYARGRRWVADPAGTLLAGDPDEDTFFAEGWELAPDGSGWRLAAAATRTLDDIEGYRYVRRRETVEEYRERVAAGGAPPADGVRRYALLGSLVDHDVRLGGSVTVVVERAAVPQRAEAAALVERAFQAEFGRFQGGELRPAIVRLEARELLGAPGDRSTPATGGD